MKRAYFIYLGVFLLGVAFGWYGLPDGGQANISQEVRQGQLRFTNPLLECDNAEASLSNPLGVSKFNLQEYVNSQITKGEVDFISLYFRDLNNGPWIGINEREEFIGASLLKVPMMMAYLKEAEHKPEILDMRVMYEAPYVDDVQYFEHTQKIEVGNEYSIRELVEYMIKYSDNNAAALLGAHIQPQSITNTFEALGLGLPEFSKPYPVSVRTYASFFRVLFNASYLNINMSEYGLGILSSAEFNRGIEAGLPSSISVAHKFGIRETEEGEKQLHDCGIVYYGSHPYILCIMTRGDNFDTQAKVIADLSRYIYEEIKKEDE
jgi:beta-lactamase class A